MLINRNAFARTEVHKERAYGCDCKWCGTQKTTKTGKLFAYQYRQESDGGRKLPISGTFCSLACLVSYHS